MKIRTDFVTNSSSSSFILAYKIPQPDDPSNKKYIRIIEDMFATIMGSSSSDFDGTKEAVQIANVGEINNVCGEFLNSTQEELDEYFPHVLINAQRLIENGYEVYLKHVSYYDETMNSIISNMKNSGDMFFVDEI